MRRFLSITIIAIAPILIALLGRPDRSGLSAARSNLISGITTIMTDIISIPTYPYQSKLFWITNTTYNISYPVLNWGQYGNPSPAPKNYTRLILENDYLRVTLLPELGGRIYEMIFKPTGQNELYRNPVIKPTNWGPSDQGWWLAAGGIEWGLPVEEHGYETAIPWSYEIATGADGITVTVRDSTQPDRLRASIGIFLPNDRAVLLIQPKIENDRSIDLDFKWWINAMLAPGPGNSVGQNGLNPNNSDVRFIDPIDQVTIHSTGDNSLPGPNFPSGPNVGMSWPIFNDRDLSRLQNWNQWLGFFERPQALQDFAGVYDLANHEGILRIFPHSIATGAKGYGMGWLHPIDANEWTDDNSYYVEIHGGLAPTFWDSTPLNAHSAIEWTETWYPVVGLPDITTADSDAALAVTESGSNGLYVVAAGAFTTKPLPKARFALYQNGTCYFLGERTIGMMTPDTPLTYTHDVQAPLDQIAAILSSDNRLIASRNVTNDSQPPHIVVHPLDRVVTQTTFSIELGGANDNDCIRSLDVQVRDGFDGEWTDWWSSNTLFTQPFTGEAGHTYYFRARAIDLPGNQSAYTTSPWGDAFTTILTTTAPVFDPSYVVTPYFYSPNQPINYIVNVYNAGNVSSTVIVTNTPPTSTVLIPESLFIDYPGTLSFIGHTFIWSGVVTDGLIVHMYYALLPTIDLPAGSILTDTVQIGIGSTALTRTAIAIKAAAQIFLPVILVGY